MADAIHVTGFLGAGKSELVARLRALLPGLEIIEANGRAVPEFGQARVVAVADAANLASCSADPLVGPLVRAQIRAAGLVVLTRTDLVPAGQALEALAGLTAAPVVEVVPGDLPPGLPERIEALAPSPPGTTLPAALAFTEWRYAGPAGLTGAALDRMLARRPDGLYRLSGTVRCGGGGIEVQLAGRLRQTRPVPLPGQTSLVAIGPKARFRPDRMALAFSDAAASRGWLAGLFGHR